MSIREGSGTAAQVEAPAAAVAPLESDLLVCERATRRDSFGLLNINSTAASTGQEQLCQEDANSVMLCER